MIGGNALNPRDVLSQVNLRSNVDASIFMQYLMHDDLFLCPLFDLLTY